MNFLGLILNFIGTIILAFSTGTYFTWINRSISVHEGFIDVFSKRGDAHLIVPTNKHLKKSFESSKLWMIVGVIMVAFGFAFQFLALFSKIS